MREYTREREHSVVSMVIDDVDQGKRSRSGVVDEGLCERKLAEDGGQEN